MPTDLELIGKTLASLHLTAPRITSLIWTAWVIWGMGRLGMVFSFSSLRRSERYALRIMAGISVLITMAVMLHAVGYAAGWAVPRVTADGSAPHVERGLQPFAFGPLQLALLAAAGYAIDVLLWYRRRERRHSLPADASTQDTRTHLSLRKLAPGAIVIVIALFWFVIPYTWSMSYAWLEDNDPWDHAWAVDWIVKSGSFYEPLATHVDATTGQPDPIHVFHYLDAYPPGFDILLAVPAMVAKGSLSWVLKFYSVLLLPLGLILAYPSCRALAEVGFSSMHRMWSTGGSTPREETGNEHAAASRWIAATGVFMLSCTPGYPSRFIWSHLLLLVLWGGMMAPLIRLLRSWRLAIPLAWILAATQLITTVTGAILALNLLLLLAGVVSCLPCIRRRITGCAGAWGLVAFIAAFAALWPVTARLNATVVERATLASPGSDGSMASQSATDVARYQGLEARERHLRSAAVLLLALMLVCPIAAAAAHTAREGWRSAEPAWRLLAVGLAGVVLAMAWWGPMFARYAGAPSQRARLSSASSNKTAPGQASVAGLIETLAHPMDIQLGIYQQCLPWKWRGSQDRKYSLWEFVVPPPFIPGARVAINNSVNSGVGLGAAPVACVVLFIAGIVLQAFGRRRNERSGADSADSLTATVCDDIPPAGSAQGIIVALTLMLVHAFIGVHGGRSSVPFQLFAFRYWQLLTFAATFCSVVAISWIYLLCRRRPNAGFAVCALYVLTVVGLTAVSVPGYRAAAAAPYDEAIRGTEAVAASCVRMWTFWPAVFVLCGGAVGFLLARAGWPSRRCFVTVGAAVATLCGYVVLQGAMTRLILNNSEWLMSGVMDHGRGPESSMIEQLMDGKSRFGLRAGDRVFPLGGPFRFRFLVAADLDVPYYSADTYDWVPANLLAPAPDPLRSSVGLRMLEWFYDLRPIEAGGINTLVANLPVLPLRPATKGSDGSYSYQPDPKEVDFRMPVRRVAWLDLDRIRAGAGGIEVTRIERPVQKDLPRFLHSWLSRNGYEYLWFDHAFYALSSTVDCLDLDTGRVCSVNLFEVLLNDCVQSGLFALAPGQETLPESSIGEALNAPFPCRPHYLLRVLPEKAKDTYPYWLPCPNSMYNGLQ